MLSMPLLSITRYLPILRERIERRNRSRSILTQFPSACSPVAKCTQISSIESLATIEIDIILSAAPAKLWESELSKPDNRRGLSLSKLDYPITLSLKSAPERILNNPPHQPNVIKNDFTSKMLLSNKKYRGNISCCIFCWNIHTYFVA